MSYEIAPYPMSTLNAPNGVTRIAGANAYAAKLAISPITTNTRPLSVIGLECISPEKATQGTVLVTMPAHHVKLVRYE